MSEKSQPYIEDISKTKHQCKYDSTKIIFKISDYSELKEGDENEIEPVITNIGPACADFDAMGDGNFQFYKSGIFSSKKCTKNTNHAVLIVGFSENSNGEK